MDYRISAVIPSRDVDNVRFSATYLAEHSSVLDEVIIIWNGKDSPDFIKLFGEVQRNTDVQFVVQNCHGMDVYEMYNEGAKIARSPFVLFANDDMYFPLGWDSELSILTNQPFNADASVVTFSLVEPGYVDVSEKCIKNNYGMEVAVFDKAGFDVFSRSATRQIHVGKLGWYMPVIFPKNLFLLSGGYPVEAPFPYPNDIVFFEKLGRYSNAQFIQVDSMVYHFQRLSQRPERMAFDRLNLCCGIDIKDGFINADAISHPGVLNFDVEKDIWPFAENSLSIVLWRHAIEHFRFDVGREILKKILFSLKPGGYLDIYTPEMMLAAEDYLAGFNKYPNCCSAVMRLWGAGTSEFQIHKSGYTVNPNAENCLHTTLLRLGYKNLEDLSCLDADEFGIRAFKHV